MKRFAAILIILALSLSLCGCDAWMDGTYYSVTPHHEDDIDDKLESEEISSYVQLQSAVQELVRSGSEDGVIYSSGLDADRLSTYMDMVVNHVTKWDAVGAYAVDSISYELGNNAGRTAVAVSVSYNRSRSEILQIKYAEDVEEAKSAIMGALDSFDAGVVVLVNSYTATDFVQLVQNFVDSNPDVCMEMPQVTVNIYPDSGTERVVEITFAYQTSRDTLRMMQNYVGPIFHAASLNVSGEEGEHAKFSRMYSFLMERNDYRVETSLTPAYSLLRHGVGDSKAFATVYSAMCRKAGLECQTVSGTRDGNPWVWNIICEDGVYYYVDLLRSMAYGTMLRMTEANMSGYVWDYSAYPDTGPTYQPPQESEQTEEPSQETTDEAGTEPTEEIK